MVLATESPWATTSCMVVVISSTACDRLAHTSTRGFNSSRSFSLELAAAFLQNSKLWSL